MRNIQIEIERVKYAVYRRIESGWERGESEKETKENNIRNSLYCLGECGMTVN